jgi:hypothetical protein
MVYRCGILWLSVGKHTHEVKQIMKTIYILTYQYHGAVDFVEVIDTDYNRLTQLFEHLSPEISFSKISISEISVTTET